MSTPLADLGRVGPWPSVADGPTGVRKDVVARVLLGGAAPGHLPDTTAPVDPLFGSERLPARIAAGYRQAPDSARPVPGGFGV